MFTAGGPPWGSVGSARTLQNPKADTVFGAHPPRRAPSLAEERPAPPESRLQEARSDPGIETDAQHDLPDIGSHAFGQVADLVREADLYREKRVCGILDELGRSQVRGDQSDSPKALPAPRECVRG